jgi:hypothetical protein
MSGPQLIEPVGFAMDRRLLLGIKARAEAARARVQGQAAVSGAGAR